MASEGRFARRFSQILENAKDLLHPNKPETPESRQPTMVEQHRPAPVLRPRGLGAQAVDRRAHYKQLAAEHRRENKKNGHLHARSEKRPTRKFDKEEKNQIRSTFNHVRNEPSDERDR